MDGLLFHRTRDKLVQAINQSLSDFVPEEAVRDFFLWSFSLHNAERERWLHLVGISQTVQLTIKLLDGLVDGDDCKLLIEHSLPMCVYQFYEIVSDNLSIGLSSPVANDTTRDARRELVLLFNQVMVQRLQGDPRPARELLAPVRAAARQISLLHNTLNASEYEKVTRHYLAQRPSASRSAIDGAVWPLLVANIESGRQLVDKIAAYAGGPAIVQGLIKRYLGVSALLTEPELLLSRRVVPSADTILVVPTLAYLICVLKEIVQPDASLRDGLRSDLMGEVLYNAALLVRLLNDVGTALLLSAQTREQLFASLNDRVATDAPRPTFGELIVDIAARDKPLGAAVTRLNKDLAHGECNICIFGLAELPAAKALQSFQLRLDQLAGLYVQSRQYLSQLVKKVTASLHDERPMQLVLRFVSFHEYLYSHLYTETSGEYSG